MLQRAPNPASTTRARRRSARPLDPLTEAVYRLERAPEKAARSLFPSWDAEVQLAESEHQLVVRVVVPEASRRHVRVTVAGDLLTLEADRRTDGRREQRGFVRSFLLPAPVAPEAVDAVLEGGLLTVSVDKRRRAPTRRIPIS